MDLWLVDVRLGLNHCPDIKITRFKQAVFRRSLRKYYSL